MATESPLDAGGGWSGEHVRDQSQLQQFGATWDTTDSAHLLPSLPLKHIPRAWERKPQSPAAKHRFNRKIWRRHDFPLSRLAAAATASDHAKPLHNARIARIKTLLAASPSPRKIVKKRCVHTSFGQSAAANHWDHKASTPLRKRVLNRSAMSCSPTKQKKSPVTVSEVLPDLSPLAGDKDTEQDEWADVASDEEQAAQEEGQEQDHMPLSFSSKDSAQFGDHEETTGQANVLPICKEDPGEPLPAAISASPAAAASSSPTVLDATGHSPIQRSVSAPLEETLSAEARPKPRMSDDTAILHAFLNRAAASKKPSTPIAKRESLSNRRDSDVVRHALASPAKTDVLAELDPNSPSPRKSLPLVESKGSDISEDGHRDDECAEDGSEDAPEAVPETETQTGPAKAIRRSIRSRTRVVQLPPLMASPSKYAKGPNKITIRSAGTPVAIKRTDAQELSLVTRANTRKNKGGSVMPVLRLCKLATEAASPEPTEEASADDSQEGGSSEGRTVHWDPTLAYYQEFADDSDLQESRRSEPVEPTNDAVAVAVKAPTPMKPRVRRLRTPSKPTPSAPTSIAEPETGAPSSEEPSDQAQAEAPTKQKAAAPKARRSRIATPAKGLLTTASLLPADVTPAPAADTAPASKTRKPTTTRSHPAPKKLNFESSATAATVRAQVPDISGKENQSTGSKKKTAIPSVHKTTTTTPAVVPPANATATSTTAAAAVATIPKLEPPAKVPAAERIVLQNDIPGLASPAKKRPKSVMSRSNQPQHPKTQHRSTRGGEVDEGGEGEEEAMGGAIPMLGLASPAKRRVRPRVL